MKTNFFIEKSDELDRQWWQGRRHANRLTPLLSLSLRVLSLHGSLSTARLPLGVANLRPLRVPHSCLVETSWQTLRLVRSV
jgi:hypothetical protein